MVEYYKFPSIEPDGLPSRITIVSGPVIIKDDQVLLDKHGDDEFWKFPGGRLLDHNSPQANAIREVKAELGLDVRLISEPYIITFVREKDKVKEYVILIHYLATAVGEVSPGSDIREWAWHDIRNLPADCAPNIVPVVQHFTKENS